MTSAELRALLGVCALILTLALGAASIFKTLHDDDIADSTRRIAEAIERHAVPARPTSYAE